jgi:hypothetical protein
MPTGTNGDRGKKKVKKEKPLTEKDLAKLAAVDELGLLEKVKREGWGALTGAESGRLGGLMSRKSRGGRLEGDKAGSVTGP